MRSEIGMSKLRSHGTEAIAMSALVLWAFAVLLMCRVVLRHRIITGMTSSSCEFFCAQRFLRLFGGFGCNKVRSSKKLSHQKAQTIKQ